MPFALHSTLNADTAHVVDLDLCMVRLMNDRHYPWLVLIPRYGNLRDFDEVPEQDAAQLDREIRAACAVVRARYAPLKLNVAALGNQVPQLHIHVIGRFEVDAAWPRPVWGVVPPEPYAAAHLATEIEALRRAFATAMATTDSQPRGADDV
jgi:diadenosine tetraphosphate (Ap4A) HIT family hydrolase